MRTSNIEKRKLKTEPKLKLELNEDYLNLTKVF